MNKKKGVIFLLISKVINLPAIAKTAIFLALASFITKGLNIITTPIYTRLLSATEIGEVTIFNSWNNIFSIIAGLGLNMGSFNIAMMEYKNNRDKYISSILKLSTISAFAFFIIVILFEKQIIQITGLPKNLIFLMILGFIFNPAMDYWMLKKRYEYDYKKIASVSLFSSLMGAFVGIVSVAFVYKQANYSLSVVRLWGTNTIPLLFSLVLYIYQIKKGEKLFEATFWKYSLKLSIPLIVHALSKQILDISDRIMIQRLDGMDKVGIYGVIYTVSSISLIFWNAINASLVPYIFNKLSRGREEEKKIVSTVSLLLVIYSAICLFIALLAPEIVRLIATEEYYSGIYLIPPIAAGIFFTSLYNLYSNVLLFYKKTNLVMIATIIAATMNIGLNFVFIPMYGYVAAAYTTLISYVLLAFLQYVFVKYLRKGDGLFNNRFIWLMGFIVIIVTLICNILYLYTIIRYSLLCMIIILTILKRSTIIDAIKTIRFN